MRKKLLLSLLVFQLVFCSLLIATAEAVTPTGLEMIARVTGIKPEGETMPNPNQTDVNYQITGTDLGHVHDAERTFRGRVSGSRTREQPARY